jgi:hypothetical protein
MANESESLLIGLSATTRNFNEISLDASRVSTTLKQAPVDHLPTSCLFRFSYQLSSADTWQFWPISCLVRSRIDLDGKMVHCSSSTSLLEPLAFDAQVVKISRHTDQQRLHQSQQSTRQVFQTCLSPEHGRFGGLHAMVPGLETLSFPRQPCPSWVLDQGSDAATSVLEDTSSSYPLSRPLVDSLLAAKGHTAASVCSFSSSSNVFWPDRCLARASLC